MDTLLPSLVAQQREWQPDIDESDGFDSATLQLIGGLDIQWDPDGTAGVGVLVVLSYPDCRVLHTEVEHTVTDIPWQSGFLGFRECPCYRSLLHKVQGTNFVPEVCLVDGCGTLHPQGCGSASQLGMQSEFPTIGVAKSLLQPPCTVNEKQVKDTMDKQHKLMLKLENAAGQVIGCAIRQSLQIRQPVYVSIGHKISLATACSIVQQCCKHRIPEPIRQADMMARRIARCANTSSALEA